jgi:hypothetical protein
MRRRYAWVIALCGLALICDRGASASDLAGRIETLFGKVGIEGVNVDSKGTPHNAHFGSESFKTFSLLVKNLSATAADFPAVSTVPGLTYRLDPKLEVFVPASDNLGPVFVERASTLGRGKFDVGFSYVFVDFDKLEGQDLDRLTLRGLQHNDCCAHPPDSSPGVPAFENDFAEVFFDKFTLQSHVFAFTGTYGLTDDWDVNLVVPVVYTRLDVSARAHINNVAGDHTFTETGTTDESRSVSDDKLGIGDVQLRTKYHFLESNGFGMGGGLALRLETGNEDNFQGIGDTTLTPFAVVSQKLGNFDLHASSGIEVNFANSDRSRVRYAAGVTAEFFTGAALLVDVIGSSNLQNERLSVDVPQFVNKPGTSEFSTGTKRFSQEVSTDIVDVVPGLKFALGENVIGFVEFFVPINDDGLRTNFTPAGGIQATF